MNPSIILCPVAFSRNGKSAIAQALAIARWYDAELQLLQLRGRRSASCAPVATPLAEGGGDRRLADFVTGLNSEGVIVSAVDLAGDPVTSVGDYARRSGANLVVVANHGRPVGAYWRPGLYATDIARYAGCLTLAVPEAHRDRTNTTAPFTDILCPIDFSPASTAALAHTLVLAQRSGGRITLLHVLKRFPDETVHSGSRDEYRGHVQRITSDLRRALPPDAFNWFDVDTTVVSGAPHQSILATAVEISADLIVMGLPDRSARNGVVMGSTTPPVLRRTPCPVLVVPLNQNQRAAAIAGT